MGDDAGTPPLGRPLDGVRVVDFSRLLPGAYCSSLLAALGADVIKVEQPGSGDYQRDLGLQFGERGGAVFQLVNQGKRSIALDLKRPDARPVLTRLLEGADVIIESFRPGVAGRLGIDPETLRAKRPSLVCVSISGFGSDTPLAQTAAHDINYLALSGLLNRQLQAGEGIPEVPLADLVGGGLMPALNILALLIRVRTTGIGGRIDAGLADGVPLLPHEMMACAVAGLPEPRREEAEFSGEGPDYTTYRLRDGYVAVGAVEEKFWEEFCRRLDLADADRTANPPALKRRIAARFGGMTRSEAEALFQGADACVTVVQTYGEALRSDHARARQFLGEPAAVGSMPRLGSPFFFDGRRAFVGGAAPKLGEQSLEILQELGYSADEAAALAAGGASAGGGAR